MSQHLKQWRELFHLNITYLNRHSNLYSFNNFVELPDNFTLSHVSSNGEVNLDRDSLRNLTTFDSFGGVEEEPISIMITKKKNWEEILLLSIE